MSQLDLALEADISARHLSFVETGRSRPSRQVVRQLATALEMPLREQNVLMGAAGFAPRYTETPLDFAELKPVRNALDLILQMHEPYPTFVLDAQMNMIQANKASARLLNLLLEGKEIPQPPNVLRLLLRPDLLRPFIPNWKIAGRVVLNRFRQRLAIPDPPRSWVDLLNEVMVYPGVREALEEDESADSYPFLIPLTMKTGGKTLSWFTTIATLGTPQDITLQELQIESLFPADAATEHFARHKLAP